MFQAFNTARRELHVPQRRSVPQCINIGYQHYTIGQDLHCQKQGTHISPYYLGKACKPEAARGIDLHRQAQQYDTPPVHACTAPQISLSDCYRPMFPYTEVGLLL
jgi:hypothetical protein